MMSDIFIGTCGYDYLDWRGSFYPLNMKRDESIEFYASHFKAVEINFSYYKMPSPEGLLRIAEKTSKDFIYSIKAHESLTHKIDQKTLADSIRKFKLAVDALRFKKVLGAILFQFPYSFHYSKENRQYLDNLFKEFIGYPLVIEFRNAEWMSNRVVEALRMRNIAFGSTDMPELKGLPDQHSIVTSDLAYIRFHGRNREAWWGSDAAERFNYLYSEEELIPWANRIITLSDHAKKIFVFFNNHRNGQATKNAQILQKLVERIA